MYLTLSSTIEPNLNGRNINDKALRFLFPEYVVIC